MSHSWYAVQCKRNHERVVQTHLEHRGYETFLPLYKSRRRWSDRVKELEMPLFSGYLFCELNPQNRLKVVTAPGVIRIVGVGKTPVPVDDHEMASLRTIVDSQLETEPHDYMHIGDTVTIEQGPLRGLSGILMEIRDRHQLVVGVSLLRRSVAVTIHRDWAVPVEMPPILRCA
jgi:transcription antitermination factor NusG